MHTVIMTQKYYMLKTQNCQKELTTIESKISVITEKKKVKVSTKFILPRGQNIFLAMKTAEELFDKIQKLSE